RTPSNQRFQFAIDPDAAPGAVPVPIEFGFQSVHPNPFNARLAVRFGLDQMGFARLRLFDVLGREAAVLFAGPSEPAYRTAVVDGNRLSSGVYYLRLESAGRVEVRKVALVR
ncbi:MAG: T9SS type A sorting domain-containing protein, partial [Calditrichaeota bacterium]|nr:T9SS type A sorting domain-containing protein [Calditrichota bacterium]